MSRIDAMLIIALAVISFIAGLLVGLNYQAGTADITVMPCSAWATTSHPRIPPNTYTGACSKPDGTLSTP